MRLILVVALAMGSVGAGAARGEEPVPSAQAQGLIERLGAPSFEERQHAVDALLDLGMPALPALTAAKNHPNLEIRTRVRRLLVNLPQAASDLALRRLLRKLTEKGDPDLPAWRRYREVIGADAESRAYFIDVVRSYPDVFRELLALSRHPRDLPLGNPFHTRVILSDLRRPFSIAARPRLSQEMLGALWCCATHTGEHSDDVGFDYLLQQRILVRRGSAEARALLDETTPAGRIARQLMVEWITRPGSAESIDTKLRVARRLGLDDAALQLAQATLSAWGEPDGLPDAGRWDHRWTIGLFWTIALSGRRDLEPVLHPFLDRDLPAAILSERDGEQFVSEIRDLAFAALLRLRGENLETYGFQRRNALLDFDPDPVEEGIWHFPDEAGRERGFALCRQRFRELGLPQAPRELPAANVGFTFEKAGDLPAAVIDDPAGKVRVEVVRPTELRLRSTVTGRQIGSTVRVVVGAERAAKTRGVIRSWSFRNDGRYLVVAADERVPTESGAVLVINTGIGEVVLQTGPGEVGAIRNVGFGADGRTVRFDAK